MTKDEALKLALEALEEAADAIDSWGSYASGYFQVKHDLEGDISKAKSAITAIKEVLAQPEHGWTSERIAGIARLKDAQDKRLAQPSVSVEQEPVAWMYEVNNAHTCLDLFEPPDDAYDEGTLHPLYTTPPQRKPLSDEQIILIVAECAASHQHTDIHFARAIERAHGIKELV